MELDNNMGKEERILKLKEQISQEEARREETRARLAEQFVKVLTEADIEAVKEMLSSQSSIPLGDSAEIVNGLKQLKDTEEAIANYREKITDIENEGRCPRCKAAVDESDVFCSACGYNLRDKRANETKACAKCGAVLPVDAVFCMACGARADGGEPQVQEEPPRPKKRICRNCGKELPDGYLFCDNCGTMVE